MRKRDILAAVVMAAAIILTWLRCGAIAATSKTVEITIISIATAVVVTGFIASIVAATAAIRNAGKNQEKERH